MAGNLHSQGYGLGWNLPPPQPYSTIATDWADGMSFIPRLEQFCLMVVLPDHWILSATTWVQPPLPEKLPR
ncbi:MULTISPECIES: hypothetical protein [unclassified Mesorhizobium]|uniref:hypothetical protein n=1 Tax=unclassified Mesorhizobium TaxID=325217 RepID=UPI001FDED9A1|nr:MULTISPECIES: hypothetical protein [unclassified Mesorhizobium]